MEHGGSSLKRIADELASISRYLKSLVSLRKEQKDIESNRKQRTRLSYEFSLLPERLNFAQSLGVKDPMKTFAHFKQHHMARGSTMADWDRAWKSWCWKEVKYYK